MARKPKKPKVKDGVVTNSAAGIPVPPGWEPTFLAELARTGSSPLAVLAAGVSRAHVYRVRKANPEFRAQFDEARARFDALPREERAAANPHRFPVAPISPEGVVSSRPGYVIPDGWQSLYLRKLEETGLKKEAAKAVGLSGAWIKDYCRKYPDFGQQVQQVFEDSTEVLEQIAVRRAAEGSDQLMMFILKARKPDTYRENVHHEHDHAHVVGGEVTMRGLIGDADPVQIEAVKRREAARLLMAGTETVDSTAEEIFDDEDPIEEIDYDLVATG